MSVEQAVLNHNQNTQERLASLVARLDDEALAHPLGDGRTIATILGHMAFWDQRILILLRRWLAGQALPSPSDQEPENVDWVNEAAQAFHVLIAPRELARFALRTAQEVDELVKSVPPALIAAIAAAGSPITLSRGLHRGEHLDEIEEFLAAREE